MTEDIIARADLLKALSDWAKRPENAGRKQAVRTTATEIKKLVTELPPYRGKPRFKFSNYPKGYCMNCKTIVEAKVFGMALQANRIKTSLYQGWSADLAKKVWITHKDKTVYLWGDNAGYCSISYAEQDLECKVLQFTDFNWEE